MKYLKTFNLEQALTGSPIQTRAGKPVRLIHVYANPGPCPAYQLVGYINCVGESGRHNWTIAGSYMGNGEEHMYDLVMVPKTKKQKLYIYVYNQPHKGAYVTSPAFYNKDSLDNHTDGQIAEMEIDVPDEDNL